MSPTERRRSNQKSRLRSYWSSSSYSVDDVTTKALWIVLVSFEMAKKHIIDRQTWALLYGSLSSLPRVLDVTHHLRLDFSSRILLVLPHDLTRLRVLFYGWTYHNKQNKSKKHLPIKLSPWKKTCREFKTCIQRSCLHRTSAMSPKCCKWVCFRCPMFVYMLL